MWFSLITFAISILIILTVGKLLYAQEEGRSVVIIRDVIQDGLHNLSGMVTVPSACEELSVTVKQLSPASYRLDFKSWKVPYGNCGEEYVPRAFHTTAIAPAAGVEFSAGLNGKPLAVVVLPEIKKKLHE